MALRSPSRGRRLGRRKVRFRRCFPKNRYPQDSLLLLANPLPHHDFADAYRWYEPPNWHDAMHVDTDGHCIIPCMVLYFRSHDGFVTSRDTMQISTFSRRSSRHAAFCVAVPFAQVPASVMWLSAVRFFGPTASSFTRSRSVGPLFTFA